MSNFNWFGLVHYGNKDQQTPLQQQASSGYQSLATQGANQAGAYDDLLASLLPQYAEAANLTSGAAPVPTAAVAGNTNQRNPIPQPQGGNSTPYQFTLTPSEQQILNGQIDAINQQKQNSINQYTAQMAERGFVDPAATAAGLQQIEEQYNGAINDHTAQYTDAAQQQRLQNLYQLLGFAANQAASGVNQQEAGLAGEQAGGNVSQQQQNLQQEQTNNALAGLTQLLGAAVTGAFNGSGGYSGGSGSGAGTLNLSGVPASGNWTGPDSATGNLLNFGNMGSALTPTDTVASNAGAQTSAAALSPAAIENQQFNLTNGV
jgi:hypothetical protein